MNIITGCHTPQLLIRKGLQKSQTALNSTNQVGSFSRFALLRKGFWNESIEQSIVLSASDRLCSVSFIFDSLSFCCGKGSAKVSTMSSAVGANAVRYTGQSGALLFTTGRSGGREYNVHPYGLWVTHCTHRVSPPPYPPYGFTPSFRCHPPPMTLPRCWDHTIPTNIHLNIHLPTNKHYLFDAIPMVPLLGLLNTWCNTLMD